jgi:hypothetical protein
MKLTTPTSAEAKNGDIYFHSTIGLHIVFKSRYLGGVSWGEGSRAAEA